MARFFNTSGPCRPEGHYMLPPERRLAGVRGLIDQKLDFVVHAPRRVGKTTSLRSLAESLTAEGRYAALITSCEVGQKLTPDLDGSISGILANLQRRAERSLPPELRPPAADPAQPPETRLSDLLARWSEASPRPVVVFFDEIDALYDDALISVLRQLRAGFDDRFSGQTASFVGAGPRACPSPCASTGFPAGPLDPRVGLKLWSVSALDVEPASMLRSTATWDVERASMLRSTPPLAVAAPSTNRSAPAFHVATPSTPWSLLAFDVESPSTP